MFNFSQKSDIYLKIDIGSLAVKAVFFEKKKDKTNVLGWAVENIDENKILSNDNLQKDIIKTALFTAFKEAKKRVFLSGIDKKYKKQIQRRKYKTFFSFSPKEIKARAISLKLAREKTESKITKKEEEKIQEQAVKIIKEKLFSGSINDLGFLQEEFDWLSFIVVSHKIDGYSVSSLQGFKGERIEITILAVFILKDYLSFIKKAAKEIGIRKFEVCNFAKDMAFSGKIDSNNALFIDFGAEISQIVVIENSQIRAVGEVKTGGEAFTDKIGDVLGLDKNSARVLKENYSRGEMEQKSRKKMEEMLFIEIEKWYNQIKEKTAELAKKDISSYNIFLLGGGAALPGVKDVFGEKAKIFLPKDIAVLENKTQINNPQFTLLLYGFE